MAAMTSNVNHQLQTISDAEQKSDSALMVIRRVIRYVPIPEKAMSKQRIQYAEV